MFAKKFGRKYCGSSERVSSVTYSVSSAFVFFHVKYVYDWLKPTLASARIIAGRVNASARKTTSGSSRAHLADQPLPERERLRVRVVDAEDPHAALDPVQDDVAQRLPEPLPVLGCRS